MYGNTNLDVPVVFVPGGSEALALQDYFACPRFIWTRKQAERKEDEE
jgi:hypothetical protein